MGTKDNDLVLTELKRFTYEEVMEKTASERVSTLCVKATIKCIALNFKRGNIYIPVFDSKKSEREKIVNSIHSEFNGTNRVELAIKYRRSKQWVYSVLKRKEPQASKRAILIEVIEDYLPRDFIALGVSEEKAKSIAKNIAKHLQQTFPGVPFFINRADLKQVQQG